MFFPQKIFYKLSAVPAYINRNNDKNIAPMLSQNELFRLQECDGIIPQIKYIYVYLMKEIYSQYFKLPLQSQVVLTHKNAEKQHQLSAKISFYRSCFQAKIPLILFVFLFLLFPVLIFLSTILGSESYFLHR